MQSENEFRSWEKSPLYYEFERDFVKMPGEHLLGVGKTKSGKTMKAIVLARWCFERGGKTIVWFDSAKSDEILYLLNFNQPVRVLYPGRLGCEIKIENSPVEIEYIDFEIPEEVFQHISPGINIISVRPFFTSLTPYIKYMSRIMNGLINDAYRQRIRVKPIQIFMDEFGAICPARRMQENYRQQELGARIVMAIYTLRSEGIGLSAFSQSYRNVNPSVRPQFGFFLSGRHPDADPHDFIGKILDKYSPMLSKFEPDMSIIIFPDGEFKGAKLHWPLPEKPTGAKVSYSGYIIKDDLIPEKEDAVTPDYFKDISH